MNISEYLDKNKLERYLQEGLVDKSLHKRFPLMILTYSRKAIFDNVWDDITTKCRGLIVDYKTGEIIARPFEKFFNINTDYRPETQVGNLPLKEPVVTEKLDGSLGIIYTYDGEHAVASKGSFHSDHAEWATKWYRDNVPNPEWPAGFTPVTEMICESVQRHVVSYDGVEQMVVTALIHNETGGEMGRELLKHWADWNNMLCVAEHQMTVADALAANPSNEEGYVLTWYAGARPPLRVKVKVPEFLRLQKIMHGISPRTIFEHMRDSDQTLPVEWLDKAMPEVTKEVIAWRDKIAVEYTYIFSMSSAIVKQALTQCTTRKEFALYFHRPENRPYAPVCFALMDQKNYQKVIWKLIEPLIEGQKMDRWVDEEE